MPRLFSHPRFLAVYSAVLTAVFVVTTGFNLAHDWILPASAAEGSHRVDFDQLTVHRINIVEPDGTPRLVLSNKAQFPGGFFKGKEFSRPDRTAAGMLFNNDEGTENGGLIFGGHQSKDGQMHSFGHLSFDEYEQDQTLSQDTTQDGDERSTSYQINDNTTKTLITPDFLAAYNRAQSMADGRAKEDALKALFARYPMSLAPRASLERRSDRSSALRLRDPEGRTRVLLRVAADGTPALQFLDAEGKVTHEWPDAATATHPAAKQSR